jgi:hypothetical protein
LLRTRDERRCSRTADECDERASLHARPSDQTVAVCALLPISERRWGRSRELFLGRRGPLGVNFGSHGPRLTVFCPSDPKTQRGIR